MNPAFHQFQKQITDRLKFRFFLLQKLPAAFFAGLYIHTMDENHSIIGLRYKWFNRNPFGSMYFAVQSMAAEMSTGLLCWGHVYEREPAVSMIVVGVEGKFVKKVTGKVYFTCQDGQLIAGLIKDTIATKEPRTIRCRSVGANADGEEVAEFFITWSFKSK